MCSMDACDLREHFFERKNRIALPAFLANQTERQSHVNFYLMRFDTAVSAIACDLSWRKSNKYSIKYLKLNADEQTHDIAANGDHFN